LFPYAPLGRRVWQLRENVAAYDAWCVALAEPLDAPLATLDAKLSRVLPATLSAHEPATLGAQGSARLCEDGGALAGVATTISPG
jgi:hypothetical protein